MQELAYTQYQARLEALQAEVVQGIGDDALGSRQRDSETLLNVVFAGQYSAGKSSLIRMLTGREDIRIGAGVTTETATAYRYESINVWDTPGILAGQREQHDAESMAAIASADLIVYVITNELFDDVLGAAFRHLCFEQARARQIMIVVNKSQSDAASPETKLTAMAGVLEPLIPEDFPIVFTDAQSYFDALEESDEVEREELFALSNYREFIEAIDAFVVAKGLYGRLARPLSEIQAAIEKRLGELTVSDPADEGLEVILQQFKREYRGSRGKLEGQIEAALDTMAAAIVEEGNTLADALVLGPEQFHQQQVQATYNCASHCEAARSKVQADVDAACDDLEAALERIKTSSLARKVKLALSDRVDAGDFEVTAPGPDGGAFVEAPTRLDTATSKAAIESGQKGLSWLATSAVGDATKSGLGRVSGSTLHSAVKEVGSFFGYKFESWGAVKIAERIGSGARFVGPALAVLGLGMQAYDDYTQAKHAREVLNTKRQIRLAFRDYAAEVRKQFDDQTKTLLGSLVERPVSEIDSLLDQLRSSSDAVSEQIHDLRAQLSQARVLREEIADFA